MTEVSAEVVGGYSVIVTDKGHDLVSVKCGWKENKAETLIPMSMFVPMAHAFAHFSDAVERDTYPVVCEVNGERQK